MRRGTVVLECIEEFKVYARATPTMLAILELRWRMLWIYAQEIQSLSKNRAFRVLQPLILRMYEGALSVQQWKRRLTHTGELMPAMFINVNAEECAHHEELNDFQLQFPGRDPSADCATAGQTDKR